MRSKRFMMINWTNVIWIATDTNLTHTFIIMLSFELRGERLSIIDNLCLHYNNLFKLGYKNINLKALIH